MTWMPISRIQILQKLREDMRSSTRSEIVPQMQTDLVDVKTGSVRSKIGPAQG